MAGVWIDLPEEGGGAAGVTSLNSETGAINLVAGSNITITPAGQNITIAASGGGGGSPAGSSTWIQYNTAGSFDASQTLLFDGSNLEIGNGSASEFNLKIDGAKAAINFNRISSAPTTPALGRNKLYFSIAGDLTSMNNGGTESIYALRSAGQTFSGNNTFSGTTALNATTINGITYPTTDGDANSVMKTDGSGHLSLGAVPVAGSDRNVLINVGGGISSFDTFQYDYTARTLLLNAVSADTQNWQDIYGNYFAKMNKFGWLGFGQSFTQVAQLQSVSETISPPDTPDATASFDFGGSGYTEAGEGTDYNYEVYSYINFDGSNHVYSVNAAPASVTEGFLPENLDAQYQDQGVPYTGDGYNGDGTQYTFKLYAIYNSKQPSVFASFDAGNIPNDGNEYFIDFSWDAPDVSPDGWLLIRDQDSMVVTSIPDGETTFQDDNTQWVADPGYSSLSFDISVGFTDSSTIDGHRILNTTSGTYKDALTNPQPDANDWDSGSTVTPNTYTVPAAEFDGETMINTTGSLSTHYGSGFSLIVDGASAGLAGVCSFTDGQSALFEGRLGNSRIFQVSNYHNGTGDDQPSVITTAGRATSSNFASLGGSLFTSVTVVGTGANTTETSLQSYSLAGGSLVQHNHIRCEVHGTFASNANTKQLIWKWGSQVVLDTGAIAANGGDFEAVMEIYRTSDDSNQFVKAWITSNNTTFGIQMAHVSATQSSSGAVTIDFRGKNGTANANDIVTQQMYCAWLP